MKKHWIQKRKGCQWMLRYVWYSTVRNLFKVWKKLSNAVNQIIQIRQESYKNGIIDKEQILHVVKKKNITKWKRLQLIILNSVDKDIILIIVIIFIIVIVIMIVFTICDCFALWHCKRKHHLTFLFLILHVEVIIHGFVR